jgi:hypothetical protein
MYARRIFKGDRDEGYIERGLTAMSLAAMLYVKKLVTAPNGEAVTLVEKAMLYYLADSHREEERAAWPGVPLMASHNGVSERRVREILASCVRKRIVWREPRTRDNGSLQSNNWRFTVIDGEPPVSVLIDEERRQVKGRADAEKSNAVKRSRRESENNSTIQQVCSDESSQEAGAEARRVPCGSSQGGGAEVRTDGCESSQGGGAEVRTVPCGSSQDLNYQLTSTQSPEILHLTSSETADEPPSGDVGGNLEGLWTRLLSLVTDGMSPALQAKLHCDAQQCAVFVGQVCTELVVAVPSSDFAQVFASIEPEFQAAADLLNIHPPLRIVFLPREKSRTQ